MATVKAIKYGMKGDDVSNLQTTLKNAGYNIDVDGSFGPQTLAAVKQYQQKNGLDVDGMVGPQTSAKLFGGSSANTAPSTPAATPDASAPTPATTPDGDAPASAVVPEGGVKTNPTQATNITQPEYEAYVNTPYAESETVQQAHTALQSILAAQPGAYQSQWQGQIDSIINRILNREKFTYDVNSDALYQQYAEQYQRLGKIAMQDTMGQAAAMTGGYGNSYASTVGNQAYQNYLSQLNDKIPELYKLALDKYQLEGQEMYNQYGLLSDQEAQDYGRYRDSYADWLAERDYATGRYDSERDYDYGKYVDDRNFGYQVHTDEQNRAWDEYLTAIQQDQWQQGFDETVKQNAIGNEQWQQGFDFNKEQADISNEQWEKSFGEQQKQNEIANSQWQQSFNESKRQYEEAKASASSGSGGSGGSGSNNAALEHVASMSSAEVVETMQGYSADGDNTGLAAFLDDCVASGRLTEAQADEYYVKYRKGNGHTITDTTVPTRSLSGVGGGSGGQVSYKY